MPSTNTVDYNDWKKKQKVAWSPVPPQNNKKKKKSESLIERLKRQKKGKEKAIRNLNNY